MHSLTHKTSFVNGRTAIYIIMKHKIKEMLGRKMEDLKNQFGMLNRISCGDALNLIDLIPDGYIDLIICDGPYCTTEHSWDRIQSIQEYNLELIRKFSRILKDGGTAYLFGKHDCLDFIDYRPFLTLITRITTILLPI